MDDTFDSPRLSKQSILQRLERVDKALARLDSSQASYLALGLSKADLFDIFMETRNGLLAQLHALDEAEMNENFSHEFLNYSYQNEAMRNRVGQSTSDGRINLTDAPKVEEYQAIKD